MPLRLLMISSETPDQQQERRRRSGQASHETYTSTLRYMAADCVVENFCCVDGSAGPSANKLKSYSGIVFAGSPIQMYEDTVEVGAAIKFMQEVFDTGIPSFGSCAGLQIATVAAGGKVEPLDGKMDAGFSRGIVATVAGRSHPLLKGRPLVWDAPTMHSSIVSTLPEGATCLASSNQVPVESAEIFSGLGRFWGVQYHPELALAEIGEALVAQSDALVDQGLVESEEVLDYYSRDLAKLDKSPQAQDIAWKLGLDGEVTDVQKRRREIQNFLNTLST